MIDIIIPAYNSHSTIEKTLMSLSLQVNLDQLNVLIIDDCSTDGDYSKFVYKYQNSLNIREIRAPKNGGPGVARQIGLDNSKSPYVMFIDADDILIDVFGLRDMKDYMDKNENCVLLSGGFYEEIKNNSLVKHDNDLVWMFAKMYRRSFLDKNEIRFNETRANEDMGFNTKIKVSIKDKEYIWFTKERYFYLWRFKVDSITRVNDYEYTYHIGPVGFIKNKLDALLIPNANPNFVSKEAIGIMFYMYHTSLLIRNDRPDKPEWYAEVMEVIVEFYKKVGKHYISQIDKKDLAVMFNNSKGGVNAHIIPDITFFQFLEQLELAK
jgi:glycosyltransferase involved in cell wall biosynthesis